MSQLSELNSPSIALPDDDGSCQWCGLKDHGNVIDLDARFGGRWTIEWDDIAMKGSRCPWHRQIRCRYGFICPTEKRSLKLWASADSSRASKALVALCDDDRFILKQAGEGCSAIEFHLRDINQIVSILKPVRR